ncbi:MAG: GTP-binding protein [Xenococcus sp. MO_188.B8]|nr:GTP-binding protein [Xenococcus sp. MO_188.B8]
MKESVSIVAWSIDGNKLASGSKDGIVTIWHTESVRIERKLKRHFRWVNSVAWSPNRSIVASASADHAIKIWNFITGKLTKTLERHTGGVRSLSFSADGDLLASKARSNNIYIWNTKTWEVVAALHETNMSGVITSLAFHPYVPRLVTLGEYESTIRVWDIDTEVLLNKTHAQSVRYTAAKLVLVGDSGVGKTGLGWRLAHNEFKEHSSTHGQQFWVIDDLCKTRDDGTECEAVLWDLAGQHVYRPIHSIFLDNVDTSLVLFDPTNRQDPLKGAQFWLEQLKGKAQLPPSLLVGARMDRGGSTLSQEYLDQFCQKYGISGGYVGTSAKSGEGLDELIQQIESQIPWEEMATTVTTVTFKRIKDYVLTLKEKTDRKGVLVQPAELRQKLQSTDPDWQFTDAEMMTAVGHLETHGYVTILKSSAGESHILLTPDLLVDLASSIVLEANKQDKHPRELGAISEGELLQGNYHFDELKDELKGLEKAEKQILFDAAVLSFLEHNVCFRETFDNDTLLIFPGLIQQRRPLEDDFPATDDVSYVVRGRVENIYAMLVVLLGYTPSFIRINHWQKQAQYAMGENEICGFRMIEDREGEIEFILYYSDQMPGYGREQFQELFERFLYKRDVQVTRFPPVICSNGHLLERATVVSRIKDKKTFAFCAECGDKVDLPDLEKSDIVTDVPDWLKREEATARLRSTYEQHLSRVKGYRRGWATPRCYLSFAPERKNYAKKLISDLQDAGIYVIEKASQVQSDDYVILLDSPDYQRLWNQPTTKFEADKNLVKARFNGEKLISLNLEDSKGAARSHDLRTCTIGDFCDATHYPVNLFNLVLNLYSIPLNHASFEPNRKSLHQQWEQTLAGKEIEVPEPRKRFDIALSFPGEYRDFVKTVADTLAGELGRDRVFYDAYHKAELARGDLDTYLQDIYHNQAELIVVFLCAEYEQKEWCGLELRAIRDLLKQKKTAEIMPIRFDNTEIPGFFSIDGYINAEDSEPLEIADLIKERFRLNQETS